MNAIKRCEVIAATPGVGGFVRGLGRRLAAGVLLAVSLQAHECGPREIRLKVGESCLWRIHADRVEVSSDYRPTIAPGKMAARITPSRPFKAKHGDFIVTGVAPGTNTMSVFWSYTPTGGQGTCFLTVIVEAGSPPELFQTAYREGSLVTATSGVYVGASTLRHMLDYYIPAESKKLLVLTECFAGSIALSRHFVDAPNTVVVSATSPNQTGKFGGFHDDAARGLKPETDRTAADLFEGASVGKTTGALTVDGVDVSKEDLFKSSEWPLVSGGLAAEDFLLGPVLTTPSLSSRHVVVFMGSPDRRLPRVSLHGSTTIGDPSGQRLEVTDNLDRARIELNFKGEANTTVHTAGGAPSESDPTRGQDDWDHPGTLDGLEQAIREAGEAIRNSPNPAREQFILFVGDHGEEGQLAPLPEVPPVVPAVTLEPVKLTVSWSLSPKADLFYYHLGLDSSNAPGLGLTLVPETASNNVPRLQQAPARWRPPEPGSLTLELLRPDRPPMVLNAFVSGTVDLDDDGVIGSVPGEGVQLFFPVPEDVVVQDLAGSTLEVRAVHRGTHAFRVTRLSLSSGAVAKTSYAVPPPRITGVRPLANGNLELVVDGPIREPFVLESSADLSAWTLVQDVRLRVSPEAVATRPVTTANRAFYRLRWVEP